MWKSKFFQVYLSSSYKIPVYYIDAKVLSSLMKNLFSKIFLTVSILVKTDLETF